MTMSNDVIFIKFLQKECQVNTEPKIKLSVHLEVTGDDLIEMMKNLKIVFIL